MESAFKSERCIPTKKREKPKKLLLTLLKNTGRVFKCRKGFRNAGKVFKCWKGFKNAGKVLKMQERLWKVLGKVLKLWERFCCREKVGKVLKFQERF